MKKHSIFSFPLGGIWLAASVVCSGQQLATTPQATAPPRVTARLKGIPLSEALKELSRLTGVHLTASADTADLKVIVLVSDLPLDVVRARLADALHLTWMPQEAKKDQPPSFLLYRSERNRAEEHELQARGESAFRMGIEDAISLLTLPSEARAKLFADHKRLEETFRNKSSQFGLLLLSCLTPRQRADIMDGNKLEFPSDRPPPAVAPHIDEITKAFFAAIPKDAFAKTYENADCAFKVERVGKGAGSVIQILFSARGEKGTAETGTMIAGTRPEEVYPEAYFPNHKGADYADARLPLDLPTTLTAASLPSLLEKTAVTLHINIIGENYREYVNRHGKDVAVYYYSAQAGPTTIEKALDAVMVRYPWRKQDSVYLFQRPQWWQDRRADVTEATDAYLTSLLKRQPLSLDDLAEVCKTLTPDQWGWLMPRFFPASKHLTPVQTVMRFYGNLSPARQTALCRTGGIDASLLPEADQARLKTWIAETDKAALHKVQNTPGKILIAAIRVTQDVKFSPVRFSAVFQAKDGTQTVLCEQYVTINTPGEVATSSED
jgi:hypothetical protein